MKPRRTFTPEFKIDDVASPPLKKGDLGGLQ